MPSQLSITRRCQLLEEKKEQLRRSVAEQQQQNRDLMLRHNLLQAWCECLSLIQINKLRQHCNQWEDSVDAAKEFERLLEAEVSLLNQLTSSPGFKLHDAAVVLDIGVDTIAPAGDPMCYFRHILSLPPMENAASITMDEMTVLMRESTLQLSVQLHIMQENPPPEQFAAAKSQIMAVLDRVVHAFICLVMAGREDLVESANMQHLETLQPDVDGATKQASLTSSLIDRISTTAEQQHVIATGSAMYMQLLDPVIQERQCLQSQFARSQQDHSHTGSNSGNGTMSGDVLIEDMFKGRQQLLEAQQKQAARLQLLIRKEMMLRMAGMTWVVGCLSPQQVAKACVLCWPYTLRPSLLAQEIQKRAEAEQSGSSQSRPGRVSPAAGHPSE